MGLTIALSPLYGGELVEASIFNDLGHNWQLIRRNGAEGSLSQNSRGEYVLEKTNARGYLEVRYVQPVKLPAETICYFRGEYHCENALEGTMLLFRFAHRTDGEASYQSDGDRGTTIGSESLLRNCADNEWRQRNFAVKPSSDVEWHPTIQLSGNPVSILLRNLTLNDISQTKAVPQPTEALPFVYSLSEVREQLAQRECCQATLVRNAFGTMSIELNGHMITPVLYKPPVDMRHWRIVDFQQAGIGLCMVTVPLCHQLTKPGIPRKDGNYDWGILDRAVYQVLQYAPDACIVLNLIIYEPYLGWGEEHPEDIWQNASGEFALGNNCHLVRFIPRNGNRGILGWWPSYSSEIWRTDMVKIIHDMAEHVAAKDYGKAVAGVAFSSGDDGQFQYRHNDYSPVAQKAFRSFLKTKYENIANLNRRWKANYADFQNISIPIGPLRDKPFLSPGAAPDYREFQYHEGWTLRETFADAAKRGFRKNILTFAYGTPDTFTANFLKLAPSLDAVTTVMCYPYRLNGYSTGFGMSPLEYALHHKLWIEELDLRSWLTSSGNEFIDRSQGTLETIEEWRNAHRKLTGIALASHQGFWYYSMDYLKGVFFGAPEIMEEIKAVQKMHQKLQQLPPNPFRPDVCLVTSDSNDLYITSKPYEAHSNLNAQGNSLPLQEFAFENSGVPMDKASLQSIMAYPELQNYKIYIFPHVTYLSQKERAFIREKLQSNHRCIIWMHSTGYISENGKSADNIFQLTGFRVKTEEVYRRQNVFVAGKNSLTKNIPPYLSLGELRLFAQAPTGLSLWGQLSQEFTIEPTPNATVLARYQVGKIAGARIEFPDWTSILLAAPSSLSSYLLNSIALEQGAYRTGKAGHSIMMNGNFLSIHPLFDDEWEFLLPKGIAEVRDAWTGQSLGKGKRIKVPLTTGVTRWLLLCRDTED